MVGAIGWIVSQTMQITDKNKLEHCGTTQDTMVGVIRKINIYHGRGKVSILKYIKKVVEYAKEVLYGLPAEVAATINRNGVYLSGGIMKIAHVPQYISTKLGMCYHLSEEPQFVTVLGGGELLRDKELLNRFSQKAE